MLMQWWIESHTQWSIVKIISGWLLSNLPKLWLLKTNKNLTFCWIRAKTNPYIFQDSSMKNTNNSIEYTSRNSANKIKSWYPKSSMKNPMSMQMKKWWRKSWENGLILSGNTKIGKNSIKIVRKYTSSKHNHDHNRI